MNELYIGLMSGTSLDGIDAALVKFTSDSIELVSSHYEKMPAELRKNISDLCSHQDDINLLCEIDSKLGKQLADAVIKLLEKNKLSPSQITAIGSHGQTIRHYPSRSFTLQIGDPNIIAAETGITTVADFRRRDVAVGGQGAPLVPAFHQEVFFKENCNRIIVNIGGIANITILPNQNHASVSGFDTGPGNTLLDNWIEHNLGHTHDRDGNWAKEGSVNNTLLNDLLNDPYFKIPPPKSTGREYFNLSWLKKYFKQSISPEDVQATLVEFTAQTIISAIHNVYSTGEIFVCGGGVHNQFLMQRLQALAPHFHVNSTEKLGISPDFVEAIAFAWLAKQTLAKKTGNLPAVTGAKKSVILGGIFLTN